MCLKRKKQKQDIPCVCEFCEMATILNDSENVLCASKGIVCKEYNCRKFVYDPLKRVPHTLPPLPKLSENDVI